MTKWQKFLEWLKKNLIGLFCGSDGLLSIRRLVGVGLAIYGAIELHNALPPPNDSWVSLLWTFRGGIAILGTLVLFGAVTAQNIKEWKDLTKKDEGNV